MALPKKPKSQYHPFVDGSDRAQPFIVGFEDPSIGDIPWREFAKGIRRHASKDSMVLTYLVNVYQKIAKTDGIAKAMVEFWTLVGSWHVKAPTKAELKECIAKTPNGNFKDWLSKEQPAVKGLGFITNEMRTSLYQAKAGETKHAQVIVRACPDAIHLPFIASNMATIVRKYKHSKIGKRRDGKDPIDAYTEEDEGESIKDIRDVWDGFLPKRSGGDVRYCAQDVARVLKKARQQAPDDEIDIYAEVGKEMNVSKEWIKKNVKIKEGRGRPRK